MRKRKLGEEVHPQRFARRFFAELFHQPYRPLTAEKLVKLQLFIIYLGVGIDAGGAGRHPPEAHRDW